MNLALQVENSGPSGEAVWLPLVPGEDLGHLPACPGSVFFDFRPALVWTVRFIVTTRCRERWAASF